jgi:hypothetical protein
LIHLAAVTVPAGTQLLLGSVADNFKDAAGHALPGGNAQLFVSHVKDFPFDEYRLGHGGPAASAIAVWSDDRVLQFHR